jgi:hypothetical protein
MTRLFLLFAVLATGMAVWCQAPATSAAKPAEAGAIPTRADYAGEWISTLDGKVWLLLQLELHGDQLTGTITHSTDLELNDDGGLKSVSDEKVKEQVSEAIPDAGGLLVTVKSSEKRDPDQYRMLIVLPGKAANLSMVAEDMPPGMPKPQPWVLLKFDPTAKAKEPAPH